MKIYLDNSVLNRPYDDQRQPRIWLETLCFMLILQLVENREAEMVRSTFHQVENDENPVREKSEWVVACLDLAGVSVRTTTDMEKRAKNLAGAGLKPLDAAHVAAAESVAADYFVTCDDKLIRKYRGSLRLLTPPELILILTKESL